MIYDPGCQRCGLWAGKEHPCVSGRGFLSGSVLVLGEAPGKEEDKQGRCFVGKSGKLLRMALRRAGIHDVCYIDNPVRCRPPGNRNPEKEELASCRIYTEQVLARMPNLRMILCLGNVSLGEVTGKNTGVMKRSGIPEWHTYLGRRFVVFPCLHPAAVLRNPGLADTFDGDLAAAGKLLHGTPTENLVELVETDAEAEEAICGFADRGSVTAFDYETTGLVAGRNGGVLRASFYAGDSRACSCRLAGPRAVGALRRFLCSPTPKVVHNLPMEHRWSADSLGVRLRAVVADTLILSRRVDENAVAKLGVLAAAYVPEVLGFKMDSEAALENGEAWWDLSPKILGTRNALDAYATYKLFLIFGEKLGPEVMEIHRTMDIPIARAFSNMAARGIALDRQRMLEHRASHLQRAEEAEARFRSFGFTASLASPLQLTREFEAAGLLTGKETPTKQMATHESALAGVIRHVREHDGVNEYGEDITWAEQTCRAVLDYRKEITNVTRYYNGYGKAMRNGVVRSSVRWPGTETWRPTSSNPNIFNVPRPDKGPFRDCIVSRYEDGWLGEADLSQAELRVLAALSGDPVMREIFESGGDIHSKTASAIWGPGFTKDQRSLAKAVNFQIVYGGGPERLMLELEKDGIYLTLKECKEFQRVWRATYPVAAAYMASLQEYAKEHLVMETPFGLVKRHLQAKEGKTLGKVAREGANSPIQYAAAMLVNVALGRLDPENEHEDVLDHDLGLVVLSVYDSIIVDSPTERQCLEAVGHVRHVMLRVAAEQEWLTVPMGADIKVGHTWLSAKEVK